MEPTTNKPGSLFLVALFVIAVGLRSAIGGQTVATSALAGLIFAAVLLAITLHLKTKIFINWCTMLTGIGGAVVLTLPVVIFYSKIGMHRPAGNFMTWALIVTVVAVAEELYLRGVLFDSIQHDYGIKAAIIIGALAFAGLHIPLYGWGVIPLDLSVGIFLGYLRLWSGSATAPAITHVLADLLAWWLR